jgi:antitoxin component YwqK of YwqJK toxin-antitoxin module
MKHIKVLILSLVISLLSLPSWGETMDDLVERNGLYYKKFSDTPFTGRVAGTNQGNLKKGKKEGIWQHYWPSGQLMMKGKYQDGKSYGLWETYHMNGRLLVIQPFRNGKVIDGAYEYFNDDGSYDLTLTYKNNVAYKNGVPYGGLTVKNGVLVSE